METEPLKNSCDDIGVLARNVNDMYQQLLSTISHLEHEIETVGRSEQEKLDFLLLASHELKTPVTAVRGMIDGMIYHVGIYKDRDTYLKECQKSLEDLTELICRPGGTYKKALSNILSNAVKYTKPEHVLLSLHCNPILQTLWTLWMGS